MDSPMKRMLQRYGAQQYDFSALKQELKIRNYSIRTQRVYIDYNARFLSFCKKKPHEVANQDIRNYIEHLLDRCSAATARLAFNALLFYYTQVLNRKLMRNMKLPKREQKMIVPLTKEEVAAILSAITNPKHLLLIELIYCSGMRAFEAVRMKRRDILVDEGIAVVRAGKGKKDRKTILSGKCIVDLREELDKPDGYLFPGKNGHLTERSVQHIIKKAARKAGVRKKVYPHLLRHSFATHLLNGDVDIHSIQKLLGHNSLKTTERYLHISDEDIKKIRSPHDALELQLW